MYITDRLITRSRCRSTSCFLLLFSVVPVLAQDAYVCVWRNPERTMNRLFPAARDYKSVDIPLAAAVRERIESRLKAPLLPGQQDNFPYFEMTGGDRELVGYTIAASQKGEFGAIEFVFGLDTAYRIVGLYIQRSRERDNAFREKEFLDQFIGKTASQADTFEALIGNRSGVGVRAVVLGLRKELIAFQEVVASKK